MGSATHSSCRGLTRCGVFARVLGASFLPWSPFLPLLPLLTAPPPPPSPLANPLVLLHELPNFLLLFLRSQSSCLPSPLFLFFVFLLLHSSFSSSLPPSCDLRYPRTRARTVPVLQESRVGGRAEHTNFRTVSVARRMGGNRCGIGLVLEWCCRLTVPGVGI